MVALLVAFSLVALGAAGHDASNPDPAFYRPEVDCVMFSRNRVPFCRVCQRALSAVIDRHTRPM